MLVVAFNGVGEADNGVGEADKVLETLRQLKDDRLIELSKAAVIQCGAHGEVRIEETAARDTKESAIARAVAGGLLGDGAPVVGPAIMGVPASLRSCDMRSSL